MGGRALLVMGLAVLLPATAGAWEPRTLGTVEGLAHIVVDPAGGGAFARGAAGDWRIGPAGLERAEQGPRARFGRPGDIIPHGRVAYGSNVIAEAWLASPTWRYDHGALGDPIEAGALMVRLRDGRVMRYALADEFVFEDLEPRLADLDNDARDEVILVRSSRSEGAAVSVYTVGERRLEQFANSPPIGLVHRWLNPVGVADFDADGEPDIAVVETPHLGKTLVVYTRDGARLRAAGRLAGFSNHVLGSTLLDMAEVIDIDRDGVEDMVLPDAARRRIVAVTFRGGTFRVLDRGPEGAGIVTEVVSRDIDGNGLPDILYGREDGAVAALLR